MSDELQLLSDLLCRNQQTKKACTIGVIVDCTAVYKVSQNKDYIRRIKIIDRSLNQDNEVNEITHCTVMFFGKTPDELPAPTKVGQLIYLRRYDFNIWNNKFQAKRTAGNISSWTLIDGDLEDSRDYIKSTKDDFDLGSEKYIHLISPIQELRQFGRHYFQNQSVAFSSKDSNDSDLILKVKEAVNQQYTFTNGHQDFTATLEGQRPLIGSVVRLRSISKVEGNKLIKNPYTWALEVENWMRSYNELYFEGTSKKKENDSRFVTIKDLLKGKTSQPKNQRIEIQCQVVDIQPKIYKDALKYYNLNKNTVTDNKVKDSEPVYCIKLLLRDRSGNDKQQLEASLFSWDGKGGDFVPRIDLNYTEYSTQDAEKHLFEERVNYLLENTSLDRPVVVGLEANTVGKNTTYRVVSIS